MRIWLTRRLLGLALLAAIGLAGISLGVAGLVDFASDSLSFYGTIVLTIFIFVFLFIMDWLFCKNSCAEDAKSQLGGDAIVEAVEARAIVKPPEEPDELQK